MSGKGSAHLKAYLSGKRLTSGGAILAKCAECMGDYEAGGENDCRAEDCPLYPWQPYNKTSPRVKSRRGRKRVEQDL